MVRGGLFLSVVCAAGVFLGSTLPAVRAGEPVGGPWQALQRGFLTPGERLVTLHYIGQSGARAVISTSAHQLVQVMVLKTSGTWRLASATAMRGLTWQIQDQGQGWVAHLVPAAGTVDLAVPARSLTGRALAIKLGALAVQLAPVRLGHSQGEPPPLADVGASRAVVLLRDPQSSNLVYEFIWRLEHDAWVPSELYRLTMLSGLIVRRNGTTLFIDPQDASRHLSHHAIPFVMDDQAVLYNDTSMGQVSAALRNFSPGRYVRVGVIGKGRTTDIIWGTVANAQANGLVAGLQGDRINLLPAGQTGLFVGVRAIKLTAHTRIESLVNTPPGGLFQPGSQVTCSGTLNESGVLTASWLWVVGEPGTAS